MFDHKEGLEDLKQIKEVLDKFNVPFFLGYGTALGAYREKEFLPGDDDIDLGVVAKVDHKTKKAIGWMLYDLGFQPLQIAFNVYGRMEPTEIGYNGDHDTGVIVCERKAKFTIFFFNPEEQEIEGDKYYVCTAKLGALPLIATPSRFYNELKTIKFKGEKFNVPSPVEEYLDFTYEDWKDSLKRDHGLTYPELFGNKQMLEVDGEFQRVNIKNS